MLWRARLLLWWFGLSQVAMIGYCRPRLLQVDESGVRLRIALNRRSRNHLGSMYFGALMVGADVAGGFLAFYLARQQRLKLSLAFKGVSAEFLQRPEADVEFRCDEGPLIAALLADARASGQRLTRTVTISACCPSLSAEPVARFQLQLSLKVVS